MFYYVMVTSALGGSSHISLCSQTVPSLVILSVADLISQKEINFYCGIAQLMFLSLQENASYKN
jgi:hypothetical protein